MLLTVKEVAERLGITIGTVYKLTNSGTLAHYRFGVGKGTIRISEDDLQAYVKTCRAGQVRQPARPPRGNWQHLQL